MKVDSLSHVDKDGKDLRSNFGGPRRFTDLQKTKWLPVAPAVNSAAHVHGYLANLLDSSWNFTS